MSHLTAAEKVHAADRIVIFDSEHIRHLRRKPVLDVVHMHFEHPRIAAEAFRKLGCLLLDFGKEFVQFLEH